MRWEALANAPDMKDAEEPMGGRSGGDMGTADEDDAVEDREKVMKSSVRFCSGRSGSILAEAILRMERGHGLIVEKA